MARRARYSGAMTTTPQREADAAAPLREAWYYAAPGQAAHDMPPSVEGTGGAERQHEVDQAVVVRVVVLIERPGSSDCSAVRAVG